MDRFKWNKDQNVGKSVYINVGTENSVCGAIIGEKSVTLLLLLLRNSTGRLLKTQEEAVRMKDTVSTLKDAKA